MTKLPSDLSTEAWGWGGRDRGTGTEAGQTAQLWKSATPLSPSGPLVMKTDDVTNAKDWGYPWTAQAMLFTHTSHTSHIPISPFLSCSCSSKFPSGQQSHSCSRHRHPPAIPTASGPSQVAARMGHTVTHWSHPHGGRSPPAAIRQYRTCPSSPYSRVLALAATGDTQLLPLG